VGAAVEFDVTKPRTQSVFLKVLGDLRDEDDEDFSVRFVRRTFDFDLVGPDGQSDTRGSFLAQLPSAATIARAS
jgi:hypothetical protein